MKFKKLLPVLIAALATLLVIAVFLYLYFEGGAPPVADAPTVGATSSSTPKAPVTPAARPSPTPTAIKGNADFDFYVLNLSWSPDYCASSGDNDPQQCSLGKKLGFVLHGLWPQYERGYPQHCSTVKLPAEVKAKFPNLYPNDNLYTHEWDTHGTCSGLTPEGYLALSKKLKDSVAVPAPYKAPEQPVRVTTAKFKQEFVSANPAMTADSLAVYCSGSGRFLQELYVCFSTDGQPISCSREIRDKGAKTCGNPDFLVRNVR